MNQPFRAQFHTLAQRLTEPRRFLQILLGPRQVGKSTICQQVLERELAPTLLVSADQPSFRDGQWLSAQWELARQRARQDGSAILIVDEVQKISDWSEVVKAHWDEDTRAGLPLKVVLTGSAALSVQQGLGDSLAGRFETIRVPHWSYGEMQAGFGYTLEDYIYFGGYPGAADFKDDVPRWRRYVQDALIEPAIARDVLSLTRVDKPALLRRLFEVGCGYATQELSLTKLLGQLQDRGNTATLSHYLTLMNAAALLTGVSKYARQGHRRRASSPKLLVYNNALLAAMQPLSPAELRAQPAQWGRFVESAVGAHLLNECMQAEATLYYWRDRNREVDFVVDVGGNLVAIEVKSGVAPKALHFSEFEAAFGPCRKLLIGGDGMSLHDFLSSPLAALTSA